MSRMGSTNGFRRMVGAVAESAVAEALGLEAPAKLHAWQTTKWRRIGLRIGRIVGAAVWLLSVVTAIDVATLYGFSDAQTRWLIFPAGVLSLWIASPSTLTAWMGELGAALRAFVRFFTPEGEGVQLLGRVAFHGAVVAIMGYCALSGMKDIKWLSPEDGELLRALKPPLRVVFMTCIGLVWLYRLPRLRGFDVVAEWVMVQTMWFTANLIASGALFALYGSFFEDRPPDFEAIPVMISFALLASAIILILASNREYFEDHIAWFWREVPPQAGNGNPALAPPPRPRPNLLT